MLSRWQAGMAVLLSAALSQPAMPQGTPLQASWWDRTEGAASRGSGVACFEVRSDLDPTRAQLAARVLGSACSDVQALFDGIIPRTDCRGQVFLFSSQDDFMVTMRVRFGIDVRGKTALTTTIPTGLVSVACVEGATQPQFERALAREAFRQAARDFVGADLPPWLETALALHAEGGGHALAGRSVLTRAALDALRGARQEGKLLDCEELLAADRAAWTARLQGEEGPLRALQAWSIGQFLLFGGSAASRDSVGRVVRSVGQGTRGEDAWADAFGVSPAVSASIQEQWLAWLEKQEPDAVGITTDRLEFLAAGLAMLHERGKDPAALADLQKELLEQDFTLEVECYGVRRTLEAGDPANYEPDCGKGGSFEIVPPKRPSRREKGPQPPASVRTKGCKPACEVQWIPGLVDGTWAWRIACGG